MRFRKDHTENQCQDQDSNAGLTQILLIGWAVHTPWELGLNPLSNDPMEKAFSLSYTNPRSQIAGLL